MIKQSFGAFVPKPSKKKDPRIEGMSWLSTWSFAFYGAVFLVLLCRAVYDTNDQIGSYIEMQTDPFYD